MVKRKPTIDEIEKQKENQKMRISASKSARRSGNITKKTKTPRSQKKIATVRKSRY